MSRIIRSSDVFTVTDEKKCYKREDSELEKSRAEAEKLITEAYAKSEEILEKSRLEANDIVSRAEAEAEQKAESLLDESRERGYQEGYAKGKESGYEEGFKEGHEKAYNETLESRSVIIEEANQIKKNCLEEREETLNSLESEIISLVRAVSEKVINREMESEDYMIDLILKGLSSLNDKDNLIIRVSKEDYQSVIRFKPEILSRGSLIEDIDVKLDSNLAKGDCVIESSQGNVNTSIGLQIEEMEKVLKDLLFGE